ncbi:MAG: hypothetical protein Q8Q05_00170 [bacterium]|nr:hypothetical protein [bacterium]
MNSNLSVTSITVRDCDPKDPIFKPADRHWRLSLLSGTISFVFGRIPFIGPIINRWAGSYGYTAIRAGDED